MIPLRGTQHRAAVFAMVALATIAGDACAQQVAIPRKHHAWGRFIPGSWVKVRKLSEDLDEQGKVTSATTTETKTTLTRVEATSCTVQVEVTIEVAGKRFTAQPKTVRLGYNGETHRPRADATQTGTETLGFGATTARCAVLEMTVQDEERSVTTRIWYSPSTPPYVLKRRTRSIDSEGREVQPQIDVEVIAVEMPYRVLAETKSAAFIRTNEKRVSGSSVALEVFCGDIPGGIVAHTSKDLDANGKLIRRSTLELMDYGVAESIETGTRRLFRFRHKPPRRIAN